jgi:hypothetical protein
VFCVSLWFFFSEVFHILGHFLYFLYSSLIHLSVYTVLCFTLVFIQGSSEFIYQLLCLLIVFIFGVLKFLEFIL